MDKQINEQIEQVQKLLTDDEYDELADIVSIVHAWAARGNIEKARLAAARLFQFTKALKIG